MSSTETDEKTENCSATQSRYDVVAKLERLSCPFNWDLSIRRTLKDQKLIIATTAQQFQKVLDRQEGFPEQLLLYHLMVAYEHTMKDELPSAMEHMNKAEESLAEIEQQGKLKNVERVLQHLFIGTKCYVLIELDQLRETIELLEGVCEVDDMNETELAMLNGCQCSILIMFNTVEVSERINCAKTAIKYDPTNAKWHFLLGEVCRISRRATDYSTRPDDQETSAFEEAYRLSPNVLFGVTLAQLYRESWNFDMATKIYTKVHALHPTSCLVRFQLALGFIRAHECILAKECLDYIAERTPDSIRYLHYTAIYEEKCNRDFNAALPFYKKTTELCNFSAEWQYVECRRKVEPDWDPLPYMLDALEKYEDHPLNIQQDINIQIASYYLLKMDDVLSACQYLTTAIEISPNAKGLKNHLPLFDKSRPVNIYHVMAKEVQFALQHRATMYDDDKIAVLKKTLELCRKNCEDLPPPSASRAQLPNSPFSRNYRNYDQGSSSRDESNWREERPSSSSLGFSPNYPPRRSNDGPNSNKRHFGSSHERNYTSWRSEKREVQENRNERHLSNIFNNKEDSTFTDHRRGRVVPQTSPSQLRNKNASSENDAACYLVKTVKDLNL